MSFDVVSLHSRPVEHFPVRHGVIDGRDSRRSRHSDLSSFAARWQTAVGLVGPFAAALLMPTARSQIELLTDPRPDVAVGAIALLIAIAITWLLAAWALIVLSAAAASRIPGFIGADARRLLMSITPAAVRRVVLIAAGVSVAAGLAACGTPGPTGVLTVGAAPTSSAVSASATALSPARAPTSVAASSPSNVASDDAVFEFTVDLDWPITATAAAPKLAASPDITTPPGMTLSAVEALPESAAKPTGPVDPAEKETLATGNVTVRPGDSLWSIAAAHLPDGATAAQIDREWRTWYEVNQDVIGADPNIVMPGQQLHPPSAGSSDSADTAALTTSAPQETIQ